TQLEIVGMRLQLDQHRADLVGTHSQTIESIGAMIPAGDHSFAQRCAALCPGFVARLPIRARKSELLGGELGEMRVAAKRLLRPNPVWAWCLAREIAIYRELAARPPGVRVPRLIAAADDVLIVEWLGGAPLATLRHPRAPLPAHTIDALVAI